MKTSLVIQLFVWLLILITFSTAVAQTCNQAIPATTPDVSFIVSDNGTAIHKSTGLMWMRCSVGQTWGGQSCRGDAADFSWGAALQVASRNSFAGYNDWRLPNKNELVSLIEESCVSPAINTRIFPFASSSYFWSSSPYSALGDAAWSVDFGFGSVNASVKKGLLNVLLVRYGSASM